MHIIVCIKSVVLNPPVRGRIVRSADAAALNPFDRPALEVALALQETVGGSVTVLSMGPPSSRAAILDAMAMGADRGVLLCDPAMAGADTLATSRVLSAGIGKLAPWDLVLFGLRTADSDTGQVGPQTAVRLGIPLVTGARRVSSAANGDLTVDCAVDGFWERYAMRVPGSLSVHPDAVQPRDLGLAGIEAAFETDAVETWGLDALGIDPRRAGEAGSPTRVLDMRTVKKERRCRMLEGTADAQAGSLVRWLRTKGMIG